MSGRFLLILLIVIAIHSTSNWRQDRRPRIMGDKIPPRAILPDRRKIQRKIVQYHNFFRTRVVPEGSNMLRMSWHEKAAEAAQQWASKCLPLVHDLPTGRYLDNFGTCGQNIFIATQKVPWLFAIRTWFLEKENFTYGSTTNDLGAVGHYTQMVWATTHKVGCGLSKCVFADNNATFYNYVCNYCPIGNRPDLLGLPYRRGTPCDLCRNDCFRGKLCTNACHVADLWANCQELFKAWPQWLCTGDSLKGRERLRHCGATCTCRNKLHD